MSAEAETDKGSPWRKRLLIAAVYLFGSLVVAELFYRFFWSDPPMTEVVKGNHPVFHHVPKAFLKKGLGEFDFRGRKYETAKKPGAIRISFLGDSFAYGFCPHDQTIPFHLKAMLKKSFPETAFEVLNFGFVSYSPIIEEVVYRRLVARLESDYVILLYDSFDPQDDILYSKMASFDKDGRTLSVAGEEFLKTGIRRSALVRFVQYVVEVIRNGWHYLPEEQRFESRIRCIDDPEGLQWVLDYSFSILGRLAGAVEADASRFMLFQYPPPHILKDTGEFRTWLATWGVRQEEWSPPAESRFTPLVLSYCKGKGMRCYDFGPGVREMEAELGESGSRLEIYNNMDGHFTGRANKKFAAFILEKLLEEGLVDKIKPGGEIR